MKMLLVHDPPKGNKGSNSDHAAATDMGAGPAPQTVAWVPLLQQPACNRHVCTISQALLQAQARPIPASTGAFSMGHV